jgi:hypothetical protein
MALEVRSKLIGIHKELFCIHKTARNLLADCVNLLCTFCPRPRGVSPIYLAQWWDAVFSHNNIFNNFKDTLLLQKSIRDKLSPFGLQITTTITKLQNNHIAQSAILNGRTLKLH